jgi:membrane associated rhomboid family serine protease
LGIFASAESLQCRPRHARAELLFIPIGQKDNVVRRTPWVSFSLIALNFAIFTVVSFTSGGAERELELKLGAWARFLVAHPYLVPRPELAERLGAGFDDALSRARQQWERAGGRREADADAAQRRLDELSLEAVAALGRLPAQRLGFIPRNPELPKVLSSMFMHGGWLHLIGNMLFLFVSGPFLEDLYGRGLFSALYLLSGSAALGIQAAEMPDAATPVVGASGAIAGVMGAFLVRLGRARIQFLVLPIPILPMLRFKMFMPAFVVLPLWVGEQYVSARFAGDVGVAFWAHLGGFAFGFVVAVALALMRVEELWIHPAIERETTLEQHPALEAALDARLAGDLAAARQHVRAALAADASNIDALSEALELALAEDNQAEIGRFAVQYVDVCSRRGETALAMNVLGDSRLLERPMPPRFYMLAAAAVEKEGDMRAALEHYKRAAERAPNDPLALRALMKRGEILAKAGNAAAAREELERARVHPACSELFRAVIEKALAQLPPAPARRVAPEAPPEFER